MNKINRKNFIKKACLTTACMCGFGAVSLKNDIVEPVDISTSIADERLQLVREWTASLLNNLQESVEEKELKPIIKQSSLIHFNALKMDTILADYIGNIEKFIDFIEEKWGWKINYNKELKIIIADENKDICVCPVLDPKNTGSSAICYCSEGFAEIMFSKVAGVQAYAKVISSIRRGDKSCKYKILFN